MLNIEQIRESDPNWIDYELQRVSLGDKRLDWRLLDTGAKLGARPGASINQACDNWAVMVRQASPSSGAGGNDFLISPPPGSSFAPPNLWVKEAYQGRAGVFRG